MEKRVVASAQMQEVVHQALRQHVFENRGDVPPTALRRFSQTLVEVLIDDGETIEAQAASFAQQGLAVTSIVAAGIALQRTLEAARANDEAAHVGERLGRLAMATHRATLQAFDTTQRQMQNALEKARKQI